MEILEYILKALGGLMLVLILALIAGYVALRIWIKRLKNAGTAAFAGGYGNPIRIHLSQFDGPWHHQGEFDRLIAEACAMGFLPIATYLVDEMPDIYLWASYHPANNVSLTIYDHPSGGLWFEFMTCYPDDSVAMVSNHKSPKLAEVPGDLYIKNADLGLQAGLDLLLASRKAGPYRNIDGENFAELLERQYGRFMDRVIGQADISEEFVRQSGKAVGVTHVYKDEEYAQAREMQIEQYRMLAADACLDNFVRTSTLTAAEWEACKHRAFVIHDRHTAEEVVGEFCGRTADMDEADERIKALLQRKQPPLDLFAELNRLRPPNAEFLEIGQVDAPVRAKVFLAPR